SNHSASLSLLFFMIPPSPRSTLFPYTTLFRSAQGVGDLKRVLTNVKSRGTWGEVQLEMLLEQILTPDQYAKNVETVRSSGARVRSEEHTSELQSRRDLVCRLLLEKKKKKNINN